MRRTTMLFRLFPNTAGRWFSCLERRPPRPAPSAERLPLATPGRRAHLVALAVAAVFGAMAFVSSSSAEDAGLPPREAGASPQVKLLIINMFGPEAQPFIDNLRLTDNIAVPGLSPDYPDVHCNADQVCELTTGMGHTNAAASVSALVYSGKLDLTAAYFLIAGIAGIDPTQGTLGSAAWAHYLIDYGIAWEIDARTLPVTWSTGYLGINTKNPGEKPKLDYRTEVFELDPALMQRAFELSRNEILTDSPTAVAYRGHWDISPAKDPPKVVQCDTAAGDTWWHGALLEKRAQDWTKLLTDGRGTYCTTQQEDNATYEALKRGDAAQLLDIRRVVVLRTASNFDRPYPGQTPYDSLVTAISGGFVPSIQNLYVASRPLIADIVANWSAWRVGVPR